MDVVRGKLTDKVRQYGHEKLSTFNLGAEYSEAQLRAVLRQLLALGAVGVQRVAMDNGHSFDTLTLTPASRPVLRGEQAVMLRETSAHSGPKKPRRATTPSVAAANLDGAAQARFINLKAWRAEVAQAHNLPAYVIFHDATLAAIAQMAPRTLDDLQGISGMGAKKLQAYGEEVLRVVQAG